MNQVYSILLISWFSLSMLACGATPSSGQPPGEGQPLPEGVLLDRAVDLEGAGISAAGEIVPRSSGIHWFELAFPFPDSDLDAQLADGARKFGQPLHEGFDARIHIEVVEVVSGRVVSKRKTDWAPMEVSTSGGRKTCADRAELKLEKGVKYRVRLVVEEGTTRLRRFQPRFVVEASNSVRNNRLQTGVLYPVTLAVVGLMALIALACCVLKALGAGS